MCVVGVSVCKIPKKIFNRSTSFLVEAFPLTKGGNRSILKKNWTRGKGGCGGLKFYPNGKRSEKIFQVATTATR